MKRATKMSTTVRSMMAAGTLAASMTTAAVALLVATPLVPSDAWARNARNSCADCGTVVTTNRKDDKGSGTAGTVLGGVGGAVAGNVLGHSTTSTVVGGVGGAVAGNVIGRKVTSKKVWSVLVRMDDGSSREVDFTSDPGYKQGQRVRVGDGTLSRL